MVFVPFDVKKKRQTHAFSFQSTQKVIEKVRFPARDTDLYSSNRNKEEPIYLSAKSEAKILNLHGF